MAKRSRTTRTRTVYIDEKGNEYDIMGMVIEHKEEIKKLREEVDKLKGEVKIVPVTE